MGSFLMNSRQANMSIDGGNSQLFSPFMTNSNRRAVQIPTPLRHGDRNTSILSNLGGGSTGILPSFGGGAGGNSSFNERRD